MQVDVVTLFQCVLEPRFPKSMSIPSLNLLETTKHTLNFQAPWLSALGGRLEDSAPTSPILVKSSGLALANHRCADIWGLKRPLPSLLQLSAVQPHWSRIATLFSLGSAVADSEGF